METRHRSWMLAAVLATQFMMVVDASVVNLALPVIGRDLQLHQPDLTWVVNAYLVAFGGFLLVAGRAADLIGRRQVLLVGLVVFTGASVVCALAQDASLLVVARFVQGLGGALASAVILAIVTVLFPEPDERARAMSLYMFVSVGGGSAGLLIGGALTQAADWHWVFAINVPIGVVVAAAILWLLPRDRPGHPGRRLDVPGAVLSTAGVMLVVTAVVRAPTAGWAAASTLLAAVGAVVLLAAFALREARVDDPLLPRAVLGIRSLTVANLVRASVGCALYGYFFFTSLFLERVRGLGAFEAGVAFLPQTVVVALLSIGPTAWLMRRAGPFRVLVLGLVLLLAGVVAMASIRANTPVWPLLVVAFVVFGAGCGTCFVPLLTLAMAEVPPAHAGVASALVNVSMYVSSAIGLAVLGALATSRTDHVLSTGAGRPEALVGGYVVAFGAAGALVLVGLLLALRWLRPAAVPARPAEAAAAGRR